MNNIRGLWKIVNIIFSKWHKGYVRKRAFTLIEVTVSLFLLSILASLISIRAWDALNFYRYRQNAKKFYEEMTLCHHMATSVGFDLFVSIEKRGSCYVIKKNFIGSSKPAAPETTLSFISIKPFKNKLAFRSNGQIHGAKNIFIHPPQKNTKQLKPFILSFSPKVTLKET